MTTALPTAPVPTPEKAPTEKTIEQVIKEHELRSKQSDDEVDKARDELHVKTKTALDALRDYSNIKEQYLVHTIQALQQRLSKLQVDSPAESQKRDDNVAP